MRLLIFSMLFLTSCQMNTAEIAKWFSLDHLKDYSVTQLASQVEGSSFSAEDKEDLFYLFDYLMSANCYEIRDQLEDHPILFDLERSLNLRTGFLFDVFMNDYSYEKSLFQANRSMEEQAAFSVVSVWKSEISLNEINALVARVRECYPSEYGSY